MSVSADKDFLVKQMNILKLLNRVHQQNLFKDQVDEGNNYDIEAHIGNYKVRTTMSLLRQFRILSHRPMSRNADYDRHNYNFTLCFVPV